MNYFMCALHVGVTHHIVNHVKEGKLWFLPFRKVQIQFSGIRGRNIMMLMIIGNTIYV